MAMTISIQGERTSFHDIAARQFFDTDSQRVYCQTFADTFKMLEESRADYVLCALENSLYGSINEVYDLLLKYHFSIVGEVYLRIEQCLIGLPGSNLATIREVHSHPVALAQCEQYLDTQLPDVERLESHDTAGSVAMVAKLGNPAIAAIAGKEAAELYGLKVLARSIENNSQNYTRFIILSKSREAVAGANKTSLVLRTDHTPGALHAVLGSFAKRSINLTKLQSRPIIDKAWHYVFYLDVDAGTQDVRLKEALVELTALHCETTVLGSYVAGITS